MFLGWQGIILRARQVVLFLELAYSIPLWRLVTFETCGAENVNKKRVVAGIRRHFVAPCTIRPAK